MAGFWLIMATLQRFKEWSAYTGQEGFYIVLRLQVESMRILGNVGVFVELDKADFDKTLATSEFMMGNWLPTRATYPKSMQPWLWIMGNVGVFVNNDEVSFNEVFMVLREETGKREPEGEGPEPSTFFLGI